MVNSIPNILLNKIILYSLHVLYSPLIKKVKESKAFKDYVPPAALANVDFDVDTQKRMCAEIAKLIGFDFNKGTIFFILTFYITLLLITLLMIPL